MRGGEGQAEVGTSHNHESRAQLDGEATGGGDLGELHANSLDDGVAIGGKTKHDTKPTNDEDPDGHIRFAAELLLPIYVPDSGEGANGVGDIVSTMGKGIGARCENLQAPMILSCKRSTPLPWC